MHTRLSRCRLPGILVALFCSVSTVAAAQSADRDTPPDRTVPAFSVLDSAPMSIEHTDPLHKTTLMLFSTLRNDDLLPRDVGVELLPFFNRFVPADASTSDAYRKQYEGGYASSLAKFFGTSLAISQHGDPLFPEQAFSQLAIAFRTMVRDGHASSALQSLMTQYDAAVKDLDTAIAAHDDQKTESLLTTTRGLRQKLDQEPKNRVGLMVEAGSAVTLHVPQNLLSGATIERRAYWVSPIYHPDRAPLDMSAILRYIDEHDARLRTVDFGGRISARDAGIQYSLEALGRFSSRIGGAIPGEDLEHARVVGGVSYTFSRTTQVHFTVGKNYKFNVSQKGTLNASFGMTVGLGEQNLGG
jgi:hypothetical protein